MPLISEEAVERMQRDHQKMIAAIERIRATCTLTDVVPDGCNVCPPGQQQLCRGNIEQQIRNFIETTLKHNLMESLYMEQGVPAAHRAAHNRAHLAIAEQLKAIRVVLSEDGNCVLAITGVERVLSTLQEHIASFDEQLEAYLRAPA